MYPVSNDYLNKIMGSSITSSWSGTITLADGQVYEFTDGDLVQGQTKITRAICSGDDIEIGSTCMAELTLNIYLDVDRYALYDAQVELYYTLYTDSSGSSETVPCGIYTVTEATRYLGVVTVYAYDNMVKFDEDFGLSTSGSAYELLLLACTNCGVELGTSEIEILIMPNGQRDTFTYDSTSAETYRDLVGYVASYLGGYATVGVDGKLYIKPYSMASVRTIPADWRYEYRPSDYEVYYSAVSAVSMDSGVTELVSSGDDGLTYAIGENPLLQFEDSEDREDALREILSAMDAFQYTPFTAQVPCDPSLQVGDVIDFSGGLAVDGKVSAITSITLTVGGSMELECVGSNPKTSSQKTATEKALSALSTSVSSSEVVTYGYVNASEIEAANRKKTPVMQVNFVTASETPKIDIWMELLLDTQSVNADGLVDLSDPMSVTVTYALNGEELDYSPVETYAVQGKHILGLHYFIPTVEADTRYTWTVYLTMYNGAADIAAGDIHAFISGQGLVSESGTEEDGEIEVYDEVYPIAFRNAIGIKEPVDTMDADAAEVDRGSGIAEGFDGISLHGRLGQAVIGAGFGDGMTYVKAVEFITTADVLTMTIDRDYVATDGAFALRTEYDYTSYALAVDSGSLCVVEAVTDGLRSVESIEVEHG